MKLVSVPEMLEIEKEADASGLTYELMMENAGRGLAEIVADEFDHLPEQSALGLVGTGNNGGDALVALAILAEKGWQVCAYLVKPRPDDPLVERVLTAGGEVVSTSEDKRYARLRKEIHAHSVLLDGILGTGIRLPLRGVIAKVLQETKEVIDELSESPIVIAVDCPSGIDLETGEVASECLIADLTVTMAAVKTGMLKFPAYSYIGELRVVEIGLSADHKKWGKIKRIVVNRDWVRSILPARPQDSHKGTFGTLMVVAGSVNYTGAALLAGEAGYRVGAGLVNLAVPNPLYPALAGQLPEAIWLLLPHEMGVISEKAAGIVREELDSVSALVVGPGFGLEDTTRGFLAQLLEPSKTPVKSGIGFVVGQKGEEKSEQVHLPPMVVDADGLKLLSDLSDWETLLPGTVVLTPHPGEMAKLTGLDKGEIQSDRLAVAERFADAWGHVVVLKGAITVVAAPNQQTAVIPVASAALARAGTGDVLTGLIGGLLAQGVQAYPAAVAGAWIHAQAGLVAEQFLGNSASVVASDVLGAVVDVMTEIL